MEHSIKHIEKLKNIEIAGDSIRLLLFQIALDAIHDLGWEEHTSDWDPLAEWELKDGVTIYSGSHYAQFEINSSNTHISFVSDDPLDKLNNHPAIKVKGATEEWDDHFNIEISIEQIQRVTIDPQ